MQIAPSILACNFTELKKEAESVRNADYLHVDVMDGHFVPNISVGIPVVKSLKENVSMPLDVHLMISEPEKYAEDFIRAGADILCFHAEACDDVPALISKIKRLGAKPAVAIKPATPVQTVLPYVKDLFMVLVMTVEPGFGGQEMIRECLTKVTQIKAEIKKLGADCIIEADGGINAQTYREAAESGVDLAVMGTAVFTAADRAAFIEQVKAV